MADTEKLKQAIDTYAGDNETLNHFVTVAEAELGPDWVQTVFDALPDLTADERNRLDYLYRHYAAVSSWQEAQGYLSGSPLPAKAAFAERIDILAHWLDFYQEAGHQLVGQLRQKLAEMPDTTESTPAEQPIDTPVAEATPTTTDVTEAKPVESPATEPADTKAEASSESTPAQTKSEPLWLVEKIRREVAMVKDLQAWVAARCVDLGNKEVHTYPYYGLVVDIMRQARKQIQTLMDSAPMLEEIARLYPDEVHQLQDYQLLLDKDIAVATQNGLNQDLDLLGGLSIEEVKRVLGQLDTSNEKEESEPAPDGFVPILDTDSDLDEQPIKDEYKQIENVVLAENASGARNASSDEKNTSQTPQNGVRKKLSFSLGNKKPSGT